MLGERLKKLRRSKKITQEAIASKLNIKRSTYAKYETGENQPDNETLIKLADFFNVKVDYILGLSDDPYRYNAQGDKTLKEIIREGNAKWDTGIYIPDDISEDDLLFLENIFETALKRVLEQNKKEK